MMMDGVHVSVGVGVTVGVGTMTEIEPLLAMTRSTGDPSGCSAAGLSTIICLDPADAVAAMWNVQW